MKVKVKLDAEALSIIAGIEKSCAGGEPLSEGDLIFIRRFFGKAKAAALKKLDKMNSEAGEIEGALAMIGDEK